MNPTRRARLRSLFEVIHASSPGGAGALHFGGDALGAVVLFDAGRVCWAAVPGTGRRLTDLVCAQSTISRREIEATYVESRRLGVPIGELLVERKVLDPNRFRALLLQQTAETLVVLADRDDEPIWIPHRGGGYQPRFTFTLPEIAASTTATGLAIDTTAARHELATLVDGFGIGAAFDVRPEGEPLPLAVGREIELYDELRALGEWVAGVVQRWPADPPRFVIADTGAGAFVAWRACGCLFGARFRSSSGLVRALAQLMRRT